MVYFDTFSPFLQILCTLSFDTTLCSIIITLSPAVKMADVCVPQYAAGSFDQITSGRHHFRIDISDPLRSWCNHRRPLTYLSVMELLAYTKSNTIAHALKDMETEPSVIPRRLIEAFISSLAATDMSSTRDEINALEYPENNEPQSTIVSLYIAELESIGRLIEEFISSLAATDMASTNDEISAEEYPHNNDSQSATVPLDNADMECVVRRIRENLVIRDMPIKNAQYLHMPPGFLMDLELQPCDFFKYRRQIREQVKKRKREANLPKWSSRGSQNRIQGFRPEEVGWNSAVCMDNCQPSDLANKIHPLFDRNCFDDTPDAIYDELVPALRLATLFLTQPICMQFWVTLAMGHRSDDLEMSAKNGKQSQRISSHVQLTAERARIVIEYIETVGKSKLIHYRFNRQLQTLDNSGDAYAVSLPICDYRGLNSEYHNVKGPVVRSVIRFHADYYVAAMKLSQLKFQEVSQKLRFSFGFAVTIVHELAHSIEGIHVSERRHQWLDWRSSGYYKEPYWLNWHEAECGRAWEETMFGGHVQPINCRVDGSHGIAIADWPFGGKDEAPRSYRWWTVSMAYIEHMFQKSTWQRTFDLKDWRIFDIPRDGATSLLINGFSTMDPSEEDRVAKEDMAELLARASEEPATKKRVTAKGDTEERRPDQKEVISKAVAEQTGPNPELK